MSDAAVRLDQLLEQRAAVTWVNAPGPEWMDGRVVGSAIIGGQLRAEVEWRHSDGTVTRLLLGLDVIREV